MDKKSQIKVIKAGFTVIRPDNTPQPRIKYLDAVKYEWRTMRNFPSATARDREFKDLLQNPCMISD